MAVHSGSLGLMGSISKAKINLDVCRTVSRSFYFNNRHWWPFHDEK